MNKPMSWNALLQQAATASVVSKPVMKKKPATDVIYGVAEPNVQPTAATSVTVGTYELDTDGGDVEVEGLTLDRTGVTVDQSSISSSGVAVITPTEEATSSSYNSSGSSDCPVGAAAATSGTKGKGDAPSYGPNKTAQENAMDKHRASQASSGGGGGGSSNPRTTKAASVPSKKSEPSKKSKSSSSSIAKNKCQTRIRQKYNAMGLLNSSMASIEMSAC